MAAPPQQAPPMQAQVVQQAPPSLSSSQNKPPVYLTPPEALNKGYLLAAFYALCVLFH